MFLTLIGRGGAGTPTPYRNVCRGHCCAQPLGISWKLMESLSIPQHPVGNPAKTNKKGGQKTTFSIFIPTGSVGKNISLTGILTSSACFPPSHLGNSSKLDCTRFGVGYLLNAVATSTATATVAPTIGLFPIPRKPIIST